MITTQKLSTITEPVNIVAQTSLYGEQALNQMRARSIAATPLNYSIFFAYCTGQNSRLIQEIDRATEKKQPLSDAWMQHLHDTYLTHPQHTIDAASASTQRILSEVIQHVQDFAGETHAISREVSNHLTHIEAEPHLDELALRSFATNLAQQAQTIQTSSETMAKRLADAEAEIITLRESLAKTTQESERDFLTGAFNRKAFDTRLNDAMANAKLDNSELTLLMLDIDHFKQFNDNFGHLIGDEVLKIVAKTLTDTLKGMDCVARYGGEEFAIILPKTSVGSGMLVSEILRKSIASKELKRKDSGENFGVITVSIGVATFRHKADSATSLIARADEALYRSKNSGRNRVTQENIST